MRIPVAFRLSLLLALLGASACLAQQPVGTFSCTSSTGGGFSLPAYAYDGGENRIYLGLDSFGTISAPGVLNATFPQCTLTNGAAQFTLSNVEIAGAEIDVAGPGVLRDAGQAYSVATINTSSLSGSNLPSPDTPIGSMTCVGHASSSFTSSIYRFQTSNDHAFGDGTFVADLDTFENLSDPVCTVTVGPVQTVLLPDTTSDFGPIAVGKGVVDSSAHLYAQATLDVGGTTTGATTGPSVSPISMLSCQGPDFSTPLYSASLITYAGSSASGLSAELWADASALGELRSQNTFASCSFGLGSHSVSATGVTFYNPAEQGGQAFGLEAPVFYTDTGILFSSVTVDGVTYPGSSAPPAIRTNMAPVRVPAQHGPALPQ